MYQEIINYKSCGSYPEGATKSEKFVIRRRASEFKIDGKWKDIKSSWYFNYWVENRLLQNASDYYKMHAL